MTKTLTFIGMDSWSRPVYEDENEILWKDIDNREGWLGKKNENFCTSINNAFDGEPDCPMSNQFDVVFIPERIVEYRK